MSNFVVVTDTPGRLAAFLEARGIIKPSPAGGYVGVKPGMEWVEVPNPIQTDPGSGGDPMAPGYVPPTFDTRHVYLVKFAHESQTEQEADGVTTTHGDYFGPTTEPASPYDWSRFGKWVKANSTIQTAPANYTIQGQPVGNAYKVNGQNVWLIRDDPERFGVWQ